MRTWSWANSELALESAPRDVLRESAKACFDRKRETQPLKERSAGCIFKNPDPERSDGRSAGQLVDECGGKGLCRGEAVVSPLHGNFIVNHQDS